VRDVVAARVSLGDVAVDDAKEVADDVVADGGRVGKTVVDGGAAGVELVLEAARVAPGVEERVVGGLVEDGYVVGLRLCQFSPLVRP